MSGWDDDACLLDNDFLRHNTKKNVSGYSYFDPNHGCCSFKRIDDTVYSNLEFL